MVCSTLVEMEAIEAYWKHWNTLEHRMTEPAPSAGDDVDTGFKVEPRAVRPEIPQEEPWEPRLVRGGGFDGED